MSQPPDDRPALATLFALAAARRSMSRFDLVCPLTGDRLRNEGAVLVSESGVTYPRVGGVATLVAGVRIEPRQTALAPAVIDQLLDALSIPPASRTAIEEALSHQFIFAEQWIQIEADQFLHRVASSHAGLRRALAQSEVVLSAPTAERSRASLASPLTLVRRLLKGRPTRPPAVEEERMVPRLSCLFSLSRVRANACVSVNVRLENRGEATFSAAGDHPFRLSYFWLDSDGIRLEGKRTELFADLLPGRTMSVPLFIDTPTRPGCYHMSIRAVQEGLRWFDDSTIEFDLDVGPGATTADEPKWRKTGRHFDYGGDHREGIRLLELWRDTLFDRPVKVVVELGGNANPMIQHFAAPRRINVDIDPYGMIVGNLVRTLAGCDVTFLVADGMALPMPPRSIDMLVMFATFHHFPDPVALLSRLAPFISDDGLLCLMCEPIGHVHSDTVTADYLDELRRGVNEQSFELWEYAQMFDAAGLIVAEAQIDVGSAKFALRPRRSQ